MAAGDVVLNSDGTIALDADGRVRLFNADGECPDCCDEGCTPSLLAPCAECPAVTPAQYQAVFSSIGLCSGCQVLSAAADAGIDITFNQPINGMHTLDHLGGCSWQRTIAGGITVVSHDGANCGGAVRVSNTSDIVITLSRIDATRYFAVIDAPGALIVSQGGLPISLRVFSGEVTVAAGDACDMVPAIANEATATTPCLDREVPLFEFDRAIGRGGMGTFTCV